MVFVLIVGFRLDIMSATASYLEQAYEKIFRWCSFEFRQMGREAHLDVSPAMREAVRRLQQRPELLKYVPHFNYVHYPLIVIQ